MANEEHLKLLRQGIAVWNRWRDEKPDIQPDLSQADLGGMDLSRTNLSSADLSQANLKAVSLSAADFSQAVLDRADLSGAYLYGANLYGAYLYGVDLYGAYLYGANLIESVLSRASLSGADLSEADLYGADLYGADLSGAIFAEANLIETILTGANLSGANLRQAKLVGAILIRTDLSGADLSHADFNAALIEHTTFGDVDLQTARGLETVKHLGPSTIGTDTLYRSGGQIPRIFLQKAGLPDRFIDCINQIKAPAAFSPAQIDDWLDNLRQRLAVIMKDIARLEEKKAAFEPGPGSSKIQNALDECWANRENLEDQIIEFQQLKNELS